MIIACPACRTRYVVPDTAIGIDGRTVRCAKCKHSWFQDGPVLEPSTTAEPAPAEEVAPPPRGEPPEQAVQPEQTDNEAAPDTAEPADPDARPSVNFWRSSDRRGEAETDAGEADREPAAVSEPAAAPGVPTSPDVEADDAPGYTEEPDGDYSQFEHEPPFRARRNPLKLWTAAAVVFFIAASGAAVAVNYYGLPAWVPIQRPTFGMEQPQLQLDFPAEQQDLRTLPNGTEYFEVNGSVTNTGRTGASVPPILIVLRDEQDRIVYTWELAPPQSELAPGETVTIREAMVDVPRSASVVEIGWKPT